MLNHFKKTQINEPSVRIHPNAFSPNDLTSGFESRADDLDLVQLPVHEKFIQSPKRRFNIELNRKVLL